MILASYTAGVATLYTIDAAIDVYRRGRKSDHGRVVLGCAVLTVCAISIFGGAQ